MYIVHPHRLVYLANPRTGSMTLRRFLTDPENFKPGEVEIVSSGAPGEAHIWGEHHGIDEELIRLYRNRGYRITAVRRNPYDHIVSWWSLHKKEYSFKDFVKHLDDIVFYTLPEVYPETVQVLLHWSDLHVEFEGFVHHFEEIFGGKLDWHHSSHRTEGYESLYNKKLKDIVAKRYAYEIETGHYEF